VSNDGQVAAENVEITESFDEGLYYYYSSSVGGVNYLYGSGEFTLQVGTLDAGESQTIDVYLYLNSATPGEASHLTVVNSSTPDIDIFNNADEGSASFYRDGDQDVVEGDLSIAVETADPGGVVGEQSSYTLRITNNGNDDVQGVRL